MYHELYMIFVILAKSFVLSDPDVLRIVLKKLVIHDKMFSVVRSFHQSMESSFMLEGESHDMFAITIRTKKMNAVAPVLFYLYFCFTWFFIRKF